MYVCESARSLQSYHRKPQGQHEELLVIWLCRASLCQRIPRFHGEAEVKVVGAALAKIPAWKESLRPGQTSGLEEQIKSCLLAWIEALLSQSEAQAASTPPNTEAESANVSLRQDLVQVLDYAKQVPFVFPKAAAEFNPWIEKLSGTVKAVEQGALQKRLDDSVSTLLQEDVSETSLAGFMSTMRETNGMIFKSVLEEDRLFFEFGSLCFRFQLGFTVATPLRSTQSKPL